MREITQVIGSDSRLPYLVKPDAFHYHKMYPVTT